MTHVLDGTVVEDTHTAVRLHNVDLHDAQEERRVSHHVCCGGRVIAGWPAEKKNVRRDKYAAFRE